MFRHLLLLVLFCVTMSFSKTLVAVVETKAEADVLKKSEKIFLTDKLREIANVVLPAYQDYHIMTRENIDVMLPPGKTIEECEGSCLAETGRLIAADYIAQAHVGRFEDDLALTVEMYETRSGKLVSTFTANSYSAKGLLSEIEARGASFFKKIKGSWGRELSYGGDDGISGVSVGDAYSMKREKSYIVQVNSEPKGALLSVDGDPVPNCRETPCKVQLPAGKHRFSVVKDRYFKLDSIVTISSGVAVTFSLKPRFGTLKISPKYESVFYGRGSLLVTIDGEPANEGENLLNPGSHKLEITHPCYEPIAAEVKINVGSSLTFNKKMMVAKGGLNLSALRDDEPVEEPVYIDDRLVGRTPFSEAVPVCGRITIGRDKEEVPVSIEYHRDVKYVYEFLSTHHYSSSYHSERTYEDEYEDEEAYTPPVPVRKNKSENTSYVTSVKSSSEKPTLNLGESSGYYQVELGGGMGLPLGNTAFDETGLDFMLALFYGEVFAGWKFGSGMFVSVGAGIGVHNPMVMDSSSEDSYCSYSSCGMTEDEGNAMLPSPSFAFLLSAEIGYDYRMENNVEASVGVRSSAVFSSWPSFSLGFFFEVFSLMGMEIGYTTVTGDELWDDGGGVAVKLYLRFPARPGVSGFFSK